jgi:hypothetical protein
MKNEAGDTFNCNENNCNQGDKKSLEGMIEPVGPSPPPPPGAVSSQISAYSYSFVSWSVCHHGIVLIVELILIYSSSCVSWTVKHQHLAEREVTRSTIYKF